MTTAKRVIARGIPERRNGGGVTLPTFTKVDEILHIPLDQLHPNPLNPRQDLGDLTELVESIQADGIYQPLVVEQAENGYTIVMGHRRHAAARLAGLETAPCRTMAFASDIHRLAAALIENLQRVDLSPLDEARGYRQILDIPGAAQSQADLARRVGRSPAHVSKRLALLTLPESVQASVSAGNVTLEDAHYLAEKLPSLGLAETTIAEIAASRDIKYTLNAVAKDVERKRQRGELEKKAKAAGLKIIQTPDGYSRGGPQILDRIYDRQVPKKHAAEPCHAVCIHDSYDGVKMVEVCTDPKRHLLKPGASSGHGPSPEERLKRKEKRDAAKARAAFIKALIPQLSLPGGEIADHFALTILGHFGEAKAVTCELLGLEPEKKEHSYGVTFKDYDTALKGYSAKYLALATCFAKAEHTMRNQWFNGRDANVAQHLRFLVAHGYELSPVEKGWTTK